MHVREGQDERPQEHSLTDMGDSSHAEIQNEGINDSNVRSNIWHEHTKIIRETARENHQTQTILQIKPSDQEQTEQQTESQLLQSNAKSRAVHRVKSSIEQKKSLNLPMLIKESHRIQDENKKILKKIQNIKSYIP